MAEKVYGNAEKFAACHCGFAASPPSYNCCRIPWFACQEQNKTLLSCDASRGRSLNVRCGGVGANHCRNVMFSDASPIHKSATSGRNANLSPRSIIGKKYEGGANAMCKVEFECGIATSLLRYNSTFQNVDLLYARNIESQFKKVAKTKKNLRNHASLHVSPLAKKSESLVLTMACPECTSQPAR